MLLLLLLDAPSEATEGISAIGGSGREAEAGGVTKVNPASATTAAGGNAADDAGLASSGATGAAAASVMKACAGDIAPGGGVAEPAVEGDEAALDRDSAATPPSEAAEPAEPLECSRSEEACSDSDVPVDRSLRLVDIGEGDGVSHSRSGRPIVPSPKCGLRDDAGAADDRPGE